MTFQEAWDAERRAQFSNYLACTAPTEHEFAEQVWGRLQDAEARATAAEDELAVLRGLKNVLVEQCEDRISELEAERDRLAHEKHIALEALEMAEADVERLRVAAAMHCK